MMIQTDNKGRRPGGTQPVDQPETCEEFQARMPELMSSETSNIHEHVHLKTCARCTALLSELEYIGDMAKVLLEGVEPADTLWSKISKSLDHGNEKSAGTNGHSTNGHSPVPRI
jgi:hypothetical protein